MRPTTIDDIIGQERAKIVLKTLIDSAVIRDDAVPHILFHGPAGSGKTTLAKCISTACNSKLHIVNGASLKNINDVKAVIKRVKKHDVLFIDEIHNVNDRACEWLYTVMEDFEYYVDNKTIHVPKFSLVGATTSIGSLSSPFRSRFKFVCEIDKYSDDDLIQIVHKVASEYNFKLKGDIPKLIAKTCRGIPRLVVNRTEFLRDFMVGQKLTKLNSKQALDIIKLQGIDENGLTNLDQRYLTELRNSGTMSLTQLSSRLNTDKETLLNEVEPYLIEAGYIEITTKGRSLTNR